MTPAEGDPGSAPTAPPAPVDKPAPDAISTTSIVVRVVAAAVLTALGFTLWRYAARPYEHLVSRLALLVSDDSRFRAFLPTVAGHARFSPLVAYLVLLAVLPRVPLRRRLALAASGALVILWFEVFSLVTFSPMWMRAGAVRELLTEIIRGPARVAVMIALLAFALLARPRPDGAPAWRRWRAPALTAAAFLAALYVPVWLGPSEGGAWVNFGTQLRQMGQPREAADAFAHAVEVDPTQLESAKRVAAAMVARGETVKAWRLLSEQLQRFPNDVDLHMCFAETLEYDAKGHRFGPGFDLAGARQQYAFVEQHKPNTPNLYHRIGRLYEFNDAGVDGGPGFPVDKAIAAYREALRRDDRETNSKARLSLLLRGQKRLAEAIPLWRDLVAADPARTAPIRALLDAACGDAANAAACASPKR